MSRILRHINRLRLDRPLLARVRRRSAASRSAFVDPRRHAAIGIMNHLTSIIVPPRRIPKLDFSEGIPAECTTLVAVPCMLSSEAEVRRNVDTLEIRYLANRDPHLHFALVTDSPMLRRLLMSMMNWSDFAPVRSIN